MTRTFFVREPTPIHPEVSVPTDFQNVNSWAVLTAVALYMGLGALWYSPILFGAPWLEATGLTEERIAAAGARPYLIAVVMALVTAAVLAAIVAGLDLRGLGPGIRLGLLLGIGFAATTIATVHAFETRPLSLIAIDAGYALVATAAIGGLIGAWR